MEVIVALIFVSGPFNGVLTFISEPLISPLILAVSALSLVMFYEFGLRTNVSITKAKLLIIVLLCLMLGLIFLSAIYTSSLTVFVNKALIALLPVFLCIILTLSSNFSAKRFYKWIVYFSVPICLIFAYYFPQWRLGLLDRGAYNLEVISTLYLGIGGLCGFCILILIIDSPFASKSISWTMIVLFMVILFLSSARAPLFFTLLGLAVYLCYATCNMLRSGLVRKDVLSYPALFLIFLACMLQLSGKFNKDTIDVLLMSLDRITMLLDSNKGASVNTRFELLSSALATINDNYMFGTGIGSFGVEVLALDKFTHPHNIFIEAWFELGLLALFVMIVFFISSLYLAASSKNILLFTLLVYLWMNAAKSFSFAENRQLFLLIGLVVSFHGQYFLKKSKFYVSKQTRVNVAQH